MAAERTVELRGVGGTLYFKWWEWSNGAKYQNPQKVPRASNKTLKNPWTKNYSPKKSHSKFLSLKNPQKGKPVWLYRYFTLIAEQHGGDMRALSRIFRLFWMAKKILTYQATQNPWFFFFFFKMQSIRKLSNFNFQWTKTLYLNNLTHITFFITLFKGCRYK